MLDDARAPPGADYECRPGAARRPLARGYCRREPETTLLYSLVADHLDDLLAELAAASPHGAGLPRHVEKELRAFLDCGRLEKGFARVVCRECRAEHLVAFSCKGRGVCPSCTTRRMHDTAAHLVDRVIPRVPVRQWVATFPTRVRYHLAADPRLASAALTIVLRAVASFHRRRARRLGLRPERGCAAGAVSFVQRFNSALALSLHFHSLVADGVFVRRPGDPDGRPAFVALPPPTDEQVGALLRTIIRRVIALFRRHGRLDDDAVADEPDQLMLFATQSPVARRAATPDDALPPRCARLGGFSLHANAAVHANDRQGLESLCRYGLRPPLAQSRLTLDNEGRVLYRMKRTFADGTNTLSFAPRELLTRLAALVPPPRFHTVRYFGQFAAHARGRRALPSRGSQGPAPAGGTEASPAAAPSTHVPSLPLTSAADAGSRSEPAVPLCPVPLYLHDRDDTTVPEGPDEPERPRRLAWAALLRRAFRIDVSTCPQCGGRMGLIAVILDPEVAEKIIGHLGLAARAPPRRCAPDPAHQDLPLRD